MKMLRRVLFFYLFVVVGAKAQMTINLQSRAYGFGEKGYYYQGVKDSRPSTHFLGQLYAANGQKVDLEIRGGAERAFERQLSQNFRHNSKNVALLAEITELAYVESKGRDGLISGIANMRLSIYTIHEGDTTLICKPYSSSKYQRSLNSLREESYEPILSQMWFSCIEYVDNYIKLNKSRIEAFNDGVLIIIEPYETRNNRDTVHYLSRKVNWSDFKGNPRYTSKYAAAIFPTIALGSKLTIRDGKLTAILKPQVFMIQSQSWAKGVSKNNESLEHEQIHFDITKVVMDRLIAKLRNVKANTMDDLSSIIQYEYLQAFREMNRLQDAYDSESNHNLNKTKQEEWAKKVRIWLKEGA